ncbi:MAG: type II secretion system F family protein [Burkholderiales bacterium]|jgi:tight adherence protein B
MNGLLVSLTLCIFAAVALLSWSACQVWLGRRNPGRQALERRLLAHSQAAPPILDNAPLVNHTDDAANSWLHRRLHAWSASQKLPLMLHRAGVHSPPTQVLMRCVRVVVLLALTVALLGVPWVFLPGGLGLMALLGAAVLRHRQKRRSRLIEQHLPDALDLMARSMQAGHTFTSALQIAAKETNPPLGGELQTLLDELTFGVAMPQAMKSLAERVAHEDVHFFVVAVLIQHETGGKLADLLKNTATLIRERQKIAGVVRVLSAEGTLSAVILSLLPFAVAALLALINQEFIAVLWTDPLGIRLALSGLGLMMVGIFWMWRMVRIRV